MCYSWMELRFQWWLWGLLFWFDASYHNLPHKVQKQQHDTWSSPGLLFEMPVTSSSPGSRMKKLLLPIFCHSHLIFYLLKKKDDQMFGLKASHPRNSLRRRHFFPPGSSVIGIHTSAGNKELWSAEFTIQQTCKKHLEACDMASSQPSCLTHYGRTVWTCMHGRQSPKLTSCLRPWIFSREEILSVLERVVGD